jgi:hypothetical protein
MIPVGVRKNAIIALNALFGEFVSESSNPGAGVDNDDVPTSGPNLHAGGVATIFDVFFT